MQSWFEDGSLKQKQTLYHTTLLSSHRYSQAVKRMASDTSHVGLTA